MAITNNIQYVKQQQINKQLWDQCIDNATNGLIYAYSFYLDAMAGEWDGLVLNNYEAVMPLPYRKKIGIYYLYQPFLTAQLGLFGNNITADILEGFLKKIPEKFRLWEFPLNYSNFCQLKNFNLYKRINYILELSPTYEVLYKNYKEHVKRNIKKSVQFGCYLKKDIDVTEIIPLAKINSKHTGEKDLEHFSALFYILKKKLSVKTYGVFSKQNQLLASCAFTFSHNRAYYILVGNRPNSRTFGASHALIDAFIKDHSEKNLLLDFEGSDIESISFFYRSFGAKEEKYPAIKLNQLPFYLRWLKK